MKKNMILLLVLVLMLVTTFSSGNVNAEVLESSSRKPFQYVITPNSSEWKNFKTVELKEMLNIPLDEANDMDTEALLNIVLDYPYLGDLFAFNNPTAAIDFIAEQFNGLGVLFEREDFKDKLLKNYIDTSDKIIELKDNEKIKDETRWKHKYREVLLTHPKIFNKLSTLEKGNIISNSKKVARKIDTNNITLEQPDTFGIESDFSIAAVPGDIINFGYVQTPRNSNVWVYERVDHSSADKASLDAYMASAYPNATKLRTATYKYNCHSYAWYSTSTSNTWWMDFATEYMTDGSYSKLLTSYPTSANQKMYYPVVNNEHTAIVTTPSSNISSITVTSKWGSYGLYSHKADHCPYFVAAYQYTYWAPKPY